MPGYGNNTYGAGANNYGGASSTYGGAPSTYGGTETYGSNYTAQVSDVKRPPPPPPPARNDTNNDRLRVVAKYDFAGPEPGDLPFTKGDIITVTKRTERQDDWWEGICNGRSGSFPANYVTMD
ncbi:hypothetical protein IW150_005338 [Coemansia sp. RSA 2607]|nr:hypothetical protein IW150_005338 [Coemansia sp. RSA 2607]